MNTIEKVSILGAASRYDKCCPYKSSQTLGSQSFSPYSAAIYPSSGQDGKVACLFKTLFTNSCSYDCKYCINSTKSNRKKAIYEPEELSKVFMSLYRANFVHGLFLSSAIPKNPDFVTEKMIETVKLLRLKYNYKGYVHFKALPGTSYGLLKEASNYADRMSINLEVSSSSRMEELSAVKQYKTDILRRQAWIKNFKLKDGQTTQLIIGSSDETDLEILKMVDWEYENISLKRAYFSAFTPIKGTPLENKKAEAPLREHRLYNVDFLLRKYGFRLEEMKQIMQKEMLPREDPKFALAKLNIKPADVNDMDFSELIKIPGIGPKTANNIINFKKNSKIIKREQLKSLGVIIQRAEQFLKINGHCQKTLVEI